ncbi:hypothetical protein EHEL_040050 [Encephalitozoon hellem ATCC 50504]|uniref:Uncharacterized protein n=1 Tax=Encephalitozoon hellem TaxID=27973 RepID=A0A9Q9C9T0_ENCHE|nr:uncharacterized protein EHEL_040050 [Encephalitozoon hellem ATCC 50504]AFM98059.2 hypothetical protein EHEL_040050 [Encephalitozoon hellem ATCC 50504]UTX42898.1 hypothetical protein GPU96_04g06260 [Encephalitozoon hellem]WEL38355.1 hypothetical protein PFJ87_04g00240 [Encephalitozoon hellem]
MIMQSKVLLQNLEDLQPVVIAGSVIQASYALVENGVDATLSDLILPGFMNFFGPGLCANIVYKQAELSRMSLISYFIGTIIFSMFSQMRILWISTAVFPVMGRGFMLIALKNNNQPFHLVIGWLMALEMSGVLIQKLLFNKKMKISGDKAGEVFILILGLGLGRLYRLPDYTMMLVVFLVSLGPFVQYMLSLPLFSQKKQKKERGKYPRIKLPKRKAAQKAQDTLKQAK